MHKDDRVRWHLIGWGNEKDYHSVHFHAHTYVSITDGIYRGDVFDVFPGFFGTVEMRTIAPGDWLLHCHVFDHMHGGMETTYSVLEDSRAAIGSNRTRQRTSCDARQDGENYMLRCNNMNIARTSDLFPSTRWRLMANDESDNSIKILTRKVTSLDLSYNSLTERQVRNLLIRFPNLRVLKLTGNPIRKLSKYLIMRNKLLKTLVLRNTPSFQRITKNFLQTKTGNRDFDLLDFSNNPQLQPACQSHFFMNMDRLVACRDS
uniref:ferroxidase n=1 Tax=Phallusia mammillata TaxID=59560 RepID=A0A6F9DEX9_9ASCI|nr:hephaestin-like protein [Phallusia mammillata]